MAKTKAQIIDRVARKLGKLAIGQTLEADFESQISDTYDEVYDELDGMGLAAFSSASVDDEFVKYFVVLIAREHIESIPPGRQSIIANDARRAKVEISNLIARKHNNNRDVENF